MLTEIKNRRMAMEMIRIVHECDAGMRQGVEYYRVSARDGRPDATGLLARSARLPYRVEARIQAAVDKFGAPAINAALALVSNLTLADLGAELNPLKIYSDQISAARASGVTLDEIADHIKLNRAPIDRDEVLPVPPAYEDAF